MHVHHDVNIRIARETRQRDAQGAPIGIVPSRAVELRSMPGNIHQAAIVPRARKELPSMQRGMPLAELDHTFPEAVQIAVLVHERPIEPTGLVVLAVGVVVAVLRVAPRRLSMLKRRLLLLRPTDTNRLSLAGLCGLGLGP